MKPKGLPGAVYARTAIAAIALMFAADANAWSGRNARLRDIPDRTWFRVGKYNGASETIGGASEVPWAYDASSKLFVRVGGCTNLYTNAVVLYDLGTETTTTPWGVYDLSGPSNRPGGGCQRGICYDPASRHIFEMGGGASPKGYGTYGYWRGNMAARTWTNFRPADGFGGQVQAAADTANRVIVHTGRNMGGYRGCILYYPDGDSLVRAPVRPGSSSLEEAINQDWWPTMQYAPGLSGTMYFAWMNGSGWFTWLFNAKTRTWTDLKPSGLSGVPSSYVSEAYRSVLSWDNASGVMLLHIPTVGIYVYRASSSRWEKVAETNPQRTFHSQMFDYDDEHNVHVMAVQNYAYDQDIWAFRYANVAGTAAEGAQTEISRTGLKLHCSPNPVQSGASIRFNLGRASKVNLSIYDIRGKKLRTLIDRSRAAGVQSIAMGKGGLAAGHYILKLRAGRLSESRNIFIAE